MISQCLTNGCDVMITRDDSSQPRFCLECRDRFGKHTRQFNAREYNGPRIELRPRSDFAERLEAGYRIRNGEEW